MASTTTTAVEDTAKPKVIEVDVKDCPIEVVTVFSNRAEIVRNIIVEIAQPGLFTKTKSHHTILPQITSRCVRGGR